MLTESSPEYDKALKRWQRNRDVIAGEDDIKAAGEAYLKRLIGQSDKTYCAYVDSVDYFPGTARTLEANVGLVFRKPYTLTAPAGLDDYFETVTDALNLEQLARELLNETLITNWTGLLVDHDEMPAGLTKAQAQAGGYAPRLALYRAESILPLDMVRIGNKRMIVRVRVYDTPELIRELRLDNGVYTVTLHNLIGGDWIAGETITPLKDGKPLAAIPFTIITTVPNALTPPKAPLDDLCRLNVSHYRAQARLNNALNFIGSPIRYITGLDEYMDEIRVSVAEIWQFKGGKDGQEVKVNISELEGQSVPQLTAYVDALEKQMANIGSKILQSDKLVGEAAETLLIRRSAENSILAAVAIAVSGAITKNLNIAMDWMGSAPVSFALNTDFLPTPMTAQDLTAILAVVQAGRMSTETMFDMMKSGELISDAHSWEAEQARIEKDNLDRPPVDPPAPAA